MRLESNISSETGNPRAALQESAAAVPESAVAVPGEISETTRFLRHGLLFMLVGLLLYVGLYLISEQLVYKHTVRNRFYVVKTAPLSNYDYVILGASHAAVFDYEDMNARLEEMTGARILNLSVLGGGLTVNRLLLDYFLARHQTSNVVYFLDSFAFYSREWNEDRLQDTRLYNRAPFDPVLARLLLQNPSSRSAALDYLVGFSKINNSDRFQPDISADEATRFNKTYRPVQQIDRQRMDYLYPKQIDEGVFRYYLAEFENMIRDLQSHNIRLIVIKPPIPERVYRMIPNEGQFDDTVRGILQQHGVDFYDFSLVSNDEKLFFNTDHLNRTGVLQFFEDYLKEVLAQENRG